MYQENTKHLQLDMFSTVSAMPESQRTMLEESWAGAFRAHCFGRIDESIFAMLYSEKPSRPNAPVNVLVGLEILKSGMGWSDREMYEAFLFDMQVRYALGYENLSDEFIAPRTIYYFRQRLSEYNQEHGVNLLEIAFEAMTDGQVKELDIRTRKLRMDSTQLASDIRDSNRLYLLVEGLRLPGSRRRQLPHRKQCGRRQRAGRTRNLAQQSATNRRQSPPHLDGSGEIRHGSGRSRRPGHQWLARSRAAHEPRRQQLVSDHCAVA